MFHYSMPRKIWPRVCCVRHCCSSSIAVTSHEHHSASSHRKLDCLLISLFRLTSKKTSKPRYYSWAHCSMITVFYLLYNRISFMSMSLSVWVSVSWYAWPGPSCDDHRSSSSMKRRPLLTWRLTNSSRRRSEVPSRSPQCSPSLTASTLF